LKSAVRVGGLFLAAVVLLTVSAGMSGTAFAQADEIETRRADLDELQRRIHELESAIADTRSAQAEASEGLAGAERAVSEARRRLRATTDRRRAAESELAEREAERERVTSRIESRREELATLLRRHYMHGGSDVAPFLSGRDPNQISRDAHYLEHVGRARLDLIEALRADLAEQERLIAEIETQRERIARLETEQRREQRELENVLALRATALAELSGQLRSQERAVDALRENEQHLAQVVELMVRRAEQSRRAPMAAPAPSRPSSPPVARIDTGPLAAAAPAGASFRQLRGKLGYPVSGELAGRYGAPRDDGRTRWRGLFIRADAGQEVRAIAAGEVVFSEWMRGYGNLIIVDHGDDYLSIYANNDALLRVVGERVSGGAPIASVGASGGVWESGLYFEIRHQGEPVDPLTWIRRR
jgi:septal ring factor EnvC (AmiA/AmiB activator)